MAQIEQVSPVKLFVITLHNDLGVLQQATADLKAELGNSDFTSDDFPFAETGYYAAEMGSGLQRRFFSFQRLILPDQIVEIKLFTNTLEEKFARDSSRKINLDPGYIDSYKVVLASAKYGGQKIYLRNGIYADMTLVMYKKKWESFAWGFPDFKSGKYDSVLSHMRDLYKEQLKSVQAFRNSALSK